MPSEAPPSRVDPLTGHAVVIAPARRAIGAARPEGLPPAAGPCPFCPGHEAETEASLLELGTPWQVRVVANRFPLPVAGHEVLVEHRDHGADLAGYAPEHALQVLAALVQRTAALEAQGGVRAVVPFRNRGRRAGSSQPHPHAQLVALDAVPPRLAALAERLAEVRLADVLDAESPRHLATRGSWVAFAPFASERAFHVRLAGPSRRLAALDETDLEALAGLLPAVVAATLSAAGATDYNVLFTSPPVGVRGPVFLDVLPRTGGDAGFELGSGVTVCVVDPDEAARAVRGQLRE
jgi:UDPglucose--hexose-1-phosphate uridylyltransferase